MINAVNTAAPHTGVGAVALDLLFDAGDRAHALVSESVSGYGRWVYYRWTGSEFERRPDKPVIPKGGFNPGPKPPPKSIGLHVDSKLAPHIFTPFKYTHW